MNTRTKAGGAEAVPEFHYRISWRAAGAQPGHHRSSRIGGGQEFREFAPLIRHPDPRRIDLRTSLRDPFERFYVRVFNQRSAISVYAIADLSASMSFSGTVNKTQLLRDFCMSLAISAYRTGDAFGFIGCDARVRPELHLPATRRRGVAWELKQRLAALHPTESSADALLQVSRYVTGRSKLLFLISDFHLPLQVIDGALRSLSKHDVVPVMIWSHDEYANLPSWGLTRTRDLESGQARLLWLRPSLREKLVRSFNDRKHALINLFVAHGREPFLLLDRVSGEALTAYFHRA
ncbi:MAG: DUF58 domain-containing protein [Gammaproteobacteria bacterium]